MNGGPFPPPALPGLFGTTDLSATPVRPACPSRASGWVLSHAQGLPVLLTPPSCAHALVTTPADRRRASLVPRRHRRPSPSSYRVGSALSFSRLAQRSLALGPARSLIPQGDLFPQRLQPLHCFHGCSECFRPERQGPGGFRTRWAVWPFHGAHEDRDEDRDED